MYWDGQHLRVRDLGSSNGTAVNGSPVADWVSLRDGDELSFANVKAVVHLSHVTSGDDGPTGSYLAEAPQRPPEPGHGSRRLSEVPIFVSHSSEDKQAARSVASYLRRVGWTV